MFSRGTFVDLRLAAVALCFSRPFVCLYSDWEAIVGHCQTIKWTHNPGAAQSCSAATPEGAAIDFSYAYDPGGNITALNDAVRAEAFNFSYDFLDRLVAAGGVSATSILYLETYEYNQVGTMTNTTEHSGASTGPGVYEEGSTSLWLAGAWNTVSDTGASGGARAETTQAGAAVRLMFFGAGIRYVRPVGPDQGIAEVYLDGQLVSEVDNYAAEPAQQGGQDVAAVNGDHYLEIRVTGRANPASSGTTVGLDAVVVLQDPPAGGGGLMMLTLETAGETATPTPLEPTVTQTVTPTPTATVEVWETPSGIIIVPGTTAGPMDTVEPVLTETSTAEPSATPNSSATPEPSPTATPDNESTATPTETPAGMSAGGALRGPWASARLDGAPGKPGSSTFTGSGAWTLIAMALAAAALFVLQRAGQVRAWSVPIAILLGLVVVGVAFADFIGPQRTVITQTWE